MKGLSKILKLFMGLFIAALGVVMTVNANVGLPPWDVLHIGITHIIDITMGQAIILVSILLTIISVLLGEKIGIGTISNMFCVGMFIDLINKMNIIPKLNNPILGFLMLNLGMIVLAVGTVMYISCELGCGSKDGVTMGISKRTNKPVKFVRSSLEISAIIIGLFLGGNFNFGTIYSALMFGYLMQNSFKILNCNTIELNHISLRDMFNQNAFAK